ncbi:hypothetical protein N9164_04190 [Draconibacterium sp.]|nr:hypothetical protein [Draconibacterium sp.]
MNQNILFLIAVVLGCVQIVFRPDYYAPFPSVSKTKNWSFNKTLWVALFSSTGHVLGSIMLSFAGLAPAILVGRLRFFSPFKGTILVWFLILFGLILMVYGIRQAHRSRPHKHLRLYPDGTYHTHTHIDKKDSTLTNRINKKKELTIWSLFLSFAFTPFEAVIVLQVWPAFYNHFMLIVVATLIFSIATTVTMLTMTYLVMRGARFGRIKRIGLFSYVIVGTIVLVYGLVLLFL